jgi:hypothetical protein
MPNFLCVGFTCESCGERVTVLRMDTSKPAEVPGDTAVCKCSEGHIRVLTYKQALALPMRWAEQD